jgi:hypothetical protein
MHALRSCTIGMKKSNLISARADVTDHIDNEAYLREENIMLTGIA